MTWQCLIDAPSLFSIAGFIYVYGGINVEMLTLQDENQSKKGLGELYAVSIPCLVYLMQESLFWLLFLLHASQFLTVSEKENYNFTIFVESSTLHNHLYWEPICSLKLKSRPPVYIPWRKFLFFFQSYHNQFILIFVKYVT